MTEERDDLVVLVDENGEEVEFELLDTLNSMEVNMLFFCHLNKKMMEVIWGKL